jgi:hypothetical protein
MGTPESDDVLPGTMIRFMMMDDERQPKFDPGILISLESALPEHILQI